MSKFRKLVVTIAALGALAVGGAAFAQAQNASVVTKVPTQQSAAEVTSPGDTDNVQAGDQGGEAGAQDSGSEQKGEQPDSAAEGDAPDGHQDGAADTGQEVQED
ncbi:MAG: hypothetical protein QOF85_1376 [Solirubrobacterales bacterium]|jgi:uncharacterized low-complexity protein|nr:hypothetical protein [Solirubrobacterales bacterium]